MRVVVWIKSVHALQHVMGWHRIGLPLGCPAISDEVRFVEKLVHGSSVGHDSSSLRNGSVCGTEQVSNAFVSGVNTQALEFLWFLLILWNWFKRWPHMPSAWIIGSAILWILANAAAPQRCGLPDAVGWCVWWTGDHPDTKPGDCISTWPGQTIGWVYIFQQLSPRILWFLHCRASATVVFWNGFAPYRRRRP